jgi:hypothetical protein
LRAFALLLLTRRDGAQSPRRDGCHRFLLLFRREILHQFAIRVLQLRICIELFHHTGADAFATLELVDVLQHEHPFQPLSRKALDVIPFLRVGLDVGIDLGVDLRVIAELRRVAAGIGGCAVAVRIFIGSFQTHSLLMGSGGGLTESVDDLAAEEINELEGVLVLDRQAHEELGAGRTAERLLDLLARFQVPRDRGRRHADDDWLVVGRRGFHIEAGARWITICPQVTVRVRTPAACVRGAASRARPGVLAKRPHLVSIRGFALRLPGFARPLRLTR